MHPLEFLNEWLRDPIRPTGRTVEHVLDAINAHPLAQDETAQDYFIPARRYREESGRFRIWGENQDNFYCFVNSGDETLENPPVYFESCLDLIRDYGFRSNQIRDDAVLVAEDFEAFLTFTFAHQICLRNSRSPVYRESVQGFLFAQNCKIALGPEFQNPLKHEFPAGFTPWIADGAICIRDWGAAFHNSESREAFVARYEPAIGEEWSYA